MTAKLSLALSIVLAAAPAFAGGHGSHGGSGGGSSSSHGGGSSASGGGQHPSSGGSTHHAVPRTGSASGGGYARHPGGGTGRYYSHGHYYGHGYYGHGYYPYYGGSYYYPYFYGGYYPYYSDGYYPYYGGGYSYSSPYDGPSYDSGPEGAVRLLVEPEDAKVYVDGYYSGVVDDYDGMFQRLYLPMGKHEIVLKLDGYQTQHLKVYVTPGDTLKVHCSMTKGSGEAAKEIVAGDPTMEKYPPRLGDEPADRDRATADRGDEEEDDDAPPPAHVQMRRPTPRDDGATLRLTVAPDDASVYVDGSFHGTARDVHRLDLAPGQHKIEVVRPGYRTYEKDVDLGPDKATNLDVTLER